jgi:hypothetical protein
MNLGSVLAFAILVLLVPATIGHCAGDERRAYLRLAQYSAPTPVPGGLPGVAIPPPARAPNMSAPQAVPSLIAPPAAPSLSAPPAAHAPEICDCHFEVDVPVYENGKIVSWRREQRVTERSPRCCRK